MRIIIQKCRSFSNTFKCLILAEIRELLNKQLYVQIQGRVFAPGFTLAHVEAPEKYVIKLKEEEKKKKKKKMMRA